MEVRDRGGILSPPETFSAAGGSSDKSSWDEDTPCKSSSTPRALSRLLAGVFFSPASQPSPPRFALPRGDPRTLLRRRIKGNLNKLTTESFAQIAEVLAASMQASATTFEDLRVFTDLIVDAAISDQSLSELYCDLLLLLKFRCPNNLESPSSFIDTGSECALQMALALKVRDEHDVVRRWLDVDVERAQGLFTLMGHLFSRDLLSMKLIKALVTPQLGLQSLPQTYIECLCRLVSSLALENPPRETSIFLDQIIGRLEELKSTLSRRLAFMIDDIVETRAQLQETSSSSGNSSLWSILQGSVYASYMIGQAQLWESRTGGSRSAAFDFRQVMVSFSQPLIAGSWHYHPEHPPNAKPVEGEVDFTMHDSRPKRYRSPPLLRRPQTPMQRGRLDDSGSEEETEDETATHGSMPTMNLTVGGVLQQSTEDLPI